MGLEEIGKIENLSKTYGKNIILQDINLTIYQQDLIGLVGLNGCGKTTLFKSITGLVRCSGSINIFGYTLKDKNKIFEKLLFIFDSDICIPNLSGYTTLYNFIDYYRKTDKCEILNALSQVGLKGREYLSVKKYSLGMKQRLNIAKILLLKPQLVLMDEPFNGIDIDGVEELIDLIKKLNAEQKTVFIISSHQIGELEKFAKRLVVLNNKSIAVDKYISDYQYNAIAIKLQSEKDMEIIKRQFEFIRSSNGVHFFKLEKGKDNVFLKFLQENQILYSYLNTENSIKNEVLNILNGGAV